MSTMHLPGFPIPLTPTGTWELDDGALTARADARTDHFLPPTGEEGTLNSATLLTAAPDGDFVLSAQLEVEFSSAFDAGVLFLSFDNARWAKLCFEATPELKPMVVSVVTRGTSDDANSLYVAGSTAYLRISRIGRAYAFHASLDGATWEFVRFFQLGEDSETPQIGFTAQSPTGEGCTVRFTNVRLASRTLSDLRDGS